MGLTKRKDGWYVEFPVLDDGKVSNASSRGTGSQTQTLENPHPQQDGGQATRGQN